MKSVSGRHPSFHLYIFKATIPSPWTSSLSLIKKYSAVSMPLWNIWVLLNEDFLIVVGCVFLPVPLGLQVNCIFSLKGVVWWASSLVTQPGEYTSQHSKALHNFWWWPACDWSSEADPPRCWCFCLPNPCDVRGGFSHAHSHGACAARYLQVF